MAHQANPPIDLDLSTINGEHDVELLLWTVTAFQPTFSSVFLPVGDLDVPLLSSIAFILASCIVQTICLTNSGRHRNLTEQDHQSIAASLEVLAGTPSRSLEIKGSVLDARRLRAILEGLRKSRYRAQLQVEFLSSTVHGDSLDQISRAFREKECCVKSLHLLPQLRQQEWWSLVRLIERSQVQELKVWSFFGGVDNTVAFAQALHDALANNKHLHTLALHIELPVCVLDAMFRGLARNTALRVIEMERLRAETLPSFVRHLSANCHVQELNVSFLSGSALATKRGYKSLCAALQHNQSILSLKSQCMPSWVTEQTSIFLRRNIGLQRARDIVNSCDNPLATSGHLLSSLVRPKDGRLWSSAVYTLLRHCLPKLKDGAIASCQQRERGGRRETG